VVAGSNPVAPTGSTHRHQRKTSDGGGEGPQTGVALRGRPGPAEAAAASSAAIDGAYRPRRSVEAQGLRPESKTLRQLLLSEPLGLERLPLVAMQLQPPAGGQPLVGKR